LTVDLNGQQFFDAAWRVGLSGAGERVAVGSESDEP
jgi:hypothetical protein